MIEFNDLFYNKFKISNEGVYIVNKEDLYTTNFGKQWRDYNKVQIDSLNNFDISKKFLERLVFSKLENLRGKKILEIGCGAGRFTEYLVPLSKICVAVDLSSAIFHNIAIKSKKIMLVKADFLKLKSKE